MKRAFILFLFFSAVLSTGSSFAQTPKRVAVLALKNLSGEASLDYIGSGFGETLTTKLSKVKELELIERMQVVEILKEQHFQLSGFVDESTAVQAGKILGVGWTVIGSFQKAGAKLKADTRLVNVETGKIDAADDVKGNYDDIFELQEELALKLAQSLNAPVSQEEKIEIAVKPTENLSAYEWFAKGIALYEKLQVKDAIECFTKAIEMDNNFVNAYVYRGASFYSLGLEMGWKGEEQEAETLKKKAFAELTYAIELDPTNTLAYYNRSFIHDAKSPQFLEKTFADLTKAIELDPHHDSYLYWRATFYVDYKQDYQKAIIDITKAIELSPTRVKYYEYRAHYFKSLKQYDKAIDDYTKAIEIEIPSRLNILYWARHGVYCEMGQKDLANKDYQKAIECGLPSRFKNKCP